MKNVLPSTREKIIGHVPSLGRLVDDSELFNMAALRISLQCLGRHISTLDEYFIRLQI